MRNFLDKGIEWIGRIDDDEHEALAIACDIIFAYTRSFFNINLPMPKHTLGFICSIFAIATCIAWIGFAARPADARTLEDIGLTQNDVKHLTPAQIKDILDSATVDYSKDEEKAIGSDAKSETMPPNTVNCFDHYSFGSIQADFGAAVSEAAAGTPIVFAGKISNANAYPVVGGKLVVKIFKINGNGEKNTNGPDVVDEFDAATNVAIPANGSVPLSFQWNIPAHMDAGSYRAVAFFVVADKFNLLGLTFTDDIIGNAASFAVSGEKGAVRFDKSKVSVNGSKFYFAAYPPRIDGDEAKISAELVNTTAAAEDVTVTWSVYSWDAQQKSNLIREYSHVVRVDANGKKEISYSVTDKENPVYYVRVESRYKGMKSILGIRYIRPGAEKFRINFPAVTKFPLVKGEEATLFSCLHSASDLPSTSEGRLVLSLEDMNDKKIHTYEYKGPVTGSMMGVKSSFVPEKNYDRFNLKADLYKDGTLADSVVMKYDCKEIDPASCSKDSAPFMTIALSVLAAIIVIGGIFGFVRRKPRAIIAAMILACGFGFAAVPGAADAKETQWQNTDVPSLGTSWGGQKTSLKDISVTVTYKAEITKENGEALSGGESMPVGTKLNLKFVPHSSDDIYWFGMGDVYDSPYGEWRAGATAPTVGCQDKDFTNATITGMPIFGDGFRSRYMFFPLVVSPPTRSLTNVQNMTCTALDARGEASCTVSGAGPVSATFSYGSTYGKFYYSYFQTKAESDGRGFVLKPLSQISASERAGCLVKPDSLGGYNLSIPAQTVSFSFNGSNTDNQPPSTPNITGPETGRVGQTYAFGFTSTDPDGDKVKYGVNWANEETVNSWTPAPNADPEIAHVSQGVTQSLTKSWSTPGTYTIKAMAQDIKGAASGWATHTIVISEDDTNTTTSNNRNDPNDCVPGDANCPASCVTLPPVANGSSLTSGQCVAGANVSAFGLNASRDGWSWKCQGDWQTVPETCGAACESGIYSALTGACSDIPDDLCPNIRGLQRIPGVYDIDANGRCVPKTGKIKYFQFSPNTAETSCPAYWDTERPDSSLGFNMSCHIGSLQVGLSNLLSGGQNTFKYPVRLQHTLTCDIAGDEDRVVVKRLEARARCYRIGEVVEQ